MLDKVPLSKAKNLIQELFSLNYVTLYLLSFQFLSRLPAALAFFCDGGSPSALERSRLAVTMDVLGRGLAASDREATAQRPIARALDFDCGLAYQYVEARG